MAMREILGARPQLYLIHLEVICGLTRAHVQVCSTASVETCPTGKI